MGRTKGTRNPERIRTPRLLAAADALGTLAVDELALIRAACTVRGAATEQAARALALLDGLDAEEVGVLRGLTAHRIAAKREFRDDPRRYALTRRNRCILALDEADLRKREPAGEGLADTRDYREFSEPGSPSLGTVYAEFGDFRSALKAAGLLAQGQAEAHLVRRSGSPALKADWSLEERSDALALAIEHNRGRRISNENYDDTREVIGSGLPSYVQLVGKRRGGNVVSWAELHRLAYELIDRHPDRYPQAHAYRERVKRLRPGGRA